MILNLKLSKTPKYDYLSLSFDLIRSLEEVPSAIEITIRFFTRNVVPIHTQPCTTAQFTSTLCKLMVKLAS